jgi:hypothetical protein
MTITTELCILHLAIQKRIDKKLRNVLNCIYVGAKCGVMI